MPTHRSSKGSRAKQELPPLKGRTIDEVLKEVSADPIDFMIQRGTPLGHLLALFDLIEEAQEQVSRDVASLPTDLRFQVHQIEGEGKTKMLAYIDRIRTTKEYKRLQLYCYKEFGSEPNSHALRTIIAQVANLGRAKPGDAHLLSLGEAMNALQDTAALSESRSNANAGQAKGNLRATSVESSDADLADRLFREKKNTQARLIRYMADRDSASFQDVADHVQGNELTSDTAIRQIVYRTNRSLERFKARLRFTSSASRVYKDVSPE